MVMMPPKVETKNADSTSHLRELRPDIYRAIFDSSSEPIVILNPQGFYLEQNAAHAALLGYSNDELKEQTPAIHIGEKHFAHVVKTLTAKGEFRGEVVNQTKDGRTLYVDVTAFVVRDERGEPMCFVGIKHDITERKRVESALRRSEALGRYRRDRAARKPVRAGSFGLYARRVPGSPHLRVSCGPDCH